MKCRYLICYQVAWRGRWRVFSLVVSIASLSKQTALGVMFVRFKKKDKKRWHIQIVESIRVGVDLKQKIIKSIGVARSPEEIEQFTMIAEKAIVQLKNAWQLVLAFEDSEEVYFTEGIQALFGRVYKLMDANRQPCL